jgi:hypothetical protein
MSDETTQMIAGDAVAAASEEYPGARKGLSGRRWKRLRKGSFSFTHCENCDTPLRGPYCSACGQAAIDYRRSFRHVLVDVLDSFLNWDSKFIATIGWLIVRPWHLTNSFLVGRRVRYVHPLRLYLLASILFFFAVTYGAKSLKLDPLNLSSRARAEIMEDIKREDLPPEVRARIEGALKIEALPAEERAKMEAELKRPDLPAEERARIDKALKDDSWPPEVLAEMKEALKRKDLSPAMRSKMEGALEKASGNKPVTLFKVDGDDDKKPKNSFEKWMETRAKEKFGEHGTNVQLFLITLIRNLPYMVLACIPLFAFVLKILYIRKRVYYIDHLVYALHIHTFAYVGIMVIVGATIGLNRIAPGLAGWIIGLLWLAFVVQIFLSIRRVYRQGWFFSTFKFFLGGFVYLIVLFMALGVTFLITLALP